MGYRVLKHTSIHRNPHKGTETHIVLDSHTYTKHILTHLQLFHTLPSYTETHTLTMKHTHFTYLRTIYAHIYTIKHIHFTHFCRFATISHISFVCITFIVVVSWNTYTYTETHILKMKHTHFIYLAYIFA